MRKIYLLFLLTAAGLSNAFGQTPVSAPYCMPPFGTVTQGNTIYNVQYHSINNATSTATSSLYYYFNNVAPDTMSAGVIAYMNVGVSSQPSSSNTRASGLYWYVDFNKDTVFDAQNEAGYTSLPGVAVTTLNVQITVPDSALAGFTRMRVQWSNYAGDPCQTSGSVFNYNGEVEDYLAYISPTTTKPLARATQAINLTGSTATLQGTVNPNGASAAAISFEYGQTTAYTNSITGGSVASTLTGTQAPVSGNINALMPNTIYHYRVKAVNAVGTSYSADKTFVTNNSSSAVNNITGTSVSVMPVPSTGVIYISGLAPDHHFTTVISDISGRVSVMSSNLTAGVLHLEHFAKGAYFLKVIDANLGQTIYNGKILLN